jgi:hypothetical protein
VHEKLYLSFEGEATDGQPLKGEKQPFEWIIKADSKDSSVYQYACTFILVPYFALT